MDAVAALAVMRNAVAWMPNAVYAQEMREATSAIATLIEAIKPFTNDDLCKLLPSNAQGDASPVFGRDKATLYIGDFCRAKNALICAGGES